MVGFVHRMKVRIRVDPIRQLKERLHFLRLLVTTTATTMATIARMTKVRMKQIHRFLRAARADTTAFSVYPRLINDNQKEYHLGVNWAYPVSVSFSTAPAVVSMTLIVSSCCSTKTLICTQNG